MRAQRLYPGAKAGDGRARERRRWRREALGCTTTPTDVTQRRWLQGAPALHLIGLRRNPTKRARSFGAVNGTIQEKERILRASASSRVGLLIISCAEFGAQSPASGSTYSPSSRSNKRVDCEINSRTYPEVRTALWMTLHIERKSTTTCLLACARITSHTSTKHMTAPPTSYLFVYYTTYDLFV